MAEGTIKRLTDKGFGFIDTGSGSDMFFHHSNVEGIAYDDLREGQKVSFNAGEGPKGPRAENVTVTLDKDQIESNVQSILDAYNEVIQYVDTNQVYNADLNIKGPLVGETSIQRVLRQMQTIVSKEYSVGDDLNSLSVMGIKTGSDGTLSLTSSDFGDALRDQIDVYNDSVDGTLESMTASLEGRISDLKDSVAEYDYRIARYEQRLREQFTSMESMLGRMQGSSNYMSAFLSGKK